MRTPPASQNIERQRILIVRRSSLGDIVHTMPVLVALRRRFPEAYIAWLVERRFREVIVGHPCLDEVIEIRRYSKRQPVALLREIHTVGRLLRSKHFDLALDVQGLLKSGVMSYFSRAPRRLALTDNRRDFSYLFANEFVPPPQELHAVRRSLAMAEYLGCPTEPLEYRFPVGEAQQQWIRDFLAQKSIGDEMPLVGLCVGASTPNKLWPVEHFARLAEILQGELGLLTVAMGSGAEIPIAQQLGELTEVPVISAAGQTTIKQLAALIQRCSVLVAPDTGPLHIGVAVGTPVVGLYGATDPQQTGPLGDEHIVLYMDPPCGPCVRKPTCKDYPCMRQITPESVAEAVASLL